MGSLLCYCVWRYYIDNVCVSVCRLSEERMAREGAESRLRLQDDQLAKLQEELRRASENSPHSEQTVLLQIMGGTHSHTQMKTLPHFSLLHPSDRVSLQDVMSLQADLSEAAMLRRRQEEVLRQRERELTALKGALKEEVECHDREMEALREQYSQDMDNLRTTMEQFTQVGGSILGALMVYWG